MRNQKTKNNILKKILRGAGVLIIVISVLGLFVYKYNQKLQYDRMRSAKESFERNIKKESTPNLKSISKGNKVQNEPKNSREKLSDEIGFVEIDKEKVLLPIFPGTSDKELRKGTGVVEGTDIPSLNKGTTSVIAGHRGGYNGEQSFLNIDKLENGDSIKVSTENGKLNYKVVGKKIVKNDDWSQFYREDDKSKLILMTCHPYPTNRERLLIISELE